MSRKQKTVIHAGAWRLHLVRFVFISLILGLGWRLADIQVLHPDFLRDQGDARHIRNVSTTAHRGMILDRHGEPLAISTPVHSVWLNPKKHEMDDSQLQQLARLLKMKSSSISNKIKANKKRGFIYLKRRVTPKLANKIKQLKIKGLGLQREYKRYYPASEVTAHLVGFNNIDDHGQEGLELTYNEALKGIPGLKRMVRDRRGNYVGGGEQIRASKSGQNINLSVDLRLQFLAHQSLKSTVDKYNARSGTAVILDVQTAEVLAMVNQPSFNPNNRRHLKLSHLRNSAVIDVFEPGSTVKPFTVASGLKSGSFDLKTKIDTRPGTLKVSGHTITDHRNYGVIDLATLIKKSSNVGASKIALSLEPEQLWQDFSAFGMAEPTGGYFPGEVMGHMPDLRTWRKLDRATLAYGYGLNTSALQLARAYTILANGGISRPVSFQKVDKAPLGRRVFSQDIMKDVMSMMEGVVKTGGTASQAAVENYTVAGKTGTVKKAKNGGYAESRYLSLFAGVIPASNPRLAMVVMIDDPQGDKYYGGLIAAPVFSEVMTGAMRLLNIAPDNNALKSPILVAQK
ncbi:MAG: penicillin-binding transpeptidase domain-containing protein [Gammaproteobacteria bacterium]|nr:penicillin-binding transpeptidase domain-containing protein [Gammaproteobacteria bacterium]